MSTSAAHEATVTLLPDKHVCIAMHRDVESVLQPEMLHQPQNELEAKSNPRLARLTWHCLTAYRNRRPTTFILHVTGDPCSDLSARLQLSKEAVKTLPLLIDLVQSADWKPVTKSSRSNNGVYGTAVAGQCSGTKLQSDSAKLHRTTMLLPSGIWSLVSLLLLSTDMQQPEDLTLQRMEEFLEDTTGAPELAAETLQMADFMGAQKMVKRLLQFFTRCFRSLISLETPDDHQEWGSMSRHQFRALILGFLPERFCKEALTDKFSLHDALKTHKLVMTKWLQGLHRCVDLTCVWGSFPGHPTYPHLMNILQSCPQISELRVSCTDQARQMERGPRKLPYIQTLRVAKIDFREEQSGFLDVHNASPLGNIGMSVTSLTIEQVTITEPEGSADLNSQTLASALRWAFFSGVVQLRKLKHLSLPLSSWKELTKFGMGAVAPLLTREGFKVTDMHDGRVLAEVKGKSFAQVAWSIMCGENSV